MFRKLKSHGNSNESATGVVQGTTQVLGQRTNF